LSGPTLSLCMIVRDEQEMLPDFLASVAGLWDELVVVDTGSQDETTSLLEAAGARVFNFQWIDDFAAARNASLAQATGRWILFLDADERPTTEVVNQIKKLVNDPVAGAATIIMRNEWPDGGRRDSPLLRLFRNDPAIRFQYRIHEDVSTPVRDYLLANNLQMKHLPGVVHHLGYVRETVLSRNKKTRDLDLLRRSLESDPRDFYCWFKIMEIARFWDDPNLWNETAGQVADLLAQATDQEKADLKSRPFSGEFAALISQGLNVNDEDRLRWLEASADFACPSTFWKLRRGLLLENLGRTPEAREAFKSCLEEEQKHLMLSTAVRPRLGLCRIALAERKYSEAADQVIIACSEGPVDSEALLAAVSILPLADAVNQPGHFIDQHLASYPSATLNVARALVQTGQLQIASEILAPLAGEDAEAALGFLVCCLVLDLQLDIQLDVDQQKADQIFKEWISLLWRSRRSEQLTAFAERCGSVEEIFPWLAGFLAEETKRLRRENR